MEVTTKQLLQIFGIDSAGTLTKWKNNRGAADCYVGRNTWDLRKFIHWWAENIFFPTDNAEISNSRERWEEARAQKMELTVARIKGTLLPADEVTNALKELISTTKRAFLLLPHQLPTLLAGKDPAEAKEILENAVDEILKGLAEGATLAKIRKRIKK